MSEERRVFHLVHREARQRALACISEAPDGYKVTVEPKKRTDDQNAKFHAMVGDFVRCRIPWMGKPRTAKQWKVLLVSGHAIATHEGAEIIAGLEGEMVNVRESTALMSIKRGASLIEYTYALGEMHGVQWSEPRQPDRLAWADGHPQPNHRARHQP